MMTDPLADMLTRIRNAAAIERPAVEMPYSHLKFRLAEVLREEGYVLGCQTGKYVETPEGRQFDTSAKVDAAQLVLRVFLKYGPEGEQVIRHIARVSKPGLRVYVRCNELKPVLDGLGISVLSTSRGVMSDRQARAAKLGGELLCTVW
ncbi:MAG: 30S ribosomal protein S8 [Gemmataceae bacterium]|nr:30S ribosomal protein S8 [Gemmataceae bacterium]